MAHRKRRTTMSVNMNIDKAIDRSGDAVDREIKGTMKRERKAAMSGVGMHNGDIFEIGGKKRTLLG